MAGKGTLQKAPQVWDEATRLVEKFADNPHFRKEAGDIADVIPDKISEKAKIKLEPTKELQDEMKKKIDEAGKNLSIEIEMQPVIKEEAIRLASEKLKKPLEEITEDEANKFKELAIKNVAARYVHITELKSGDIKNVAKTSVKSDIFARALRDTTSGHIQAVVNNFKPEISKDVIEKTFNKMFIGKTDEENREIFENYYLSDPRHARIVHWSFQTPAGREMNLIWKKYVPKTKKGRPDFGAFEIEMEKKEKYKPSPTPSAQPPTTPAPTPPSAPGIQRKSGYRGQKRDSGGGGNP
jgi:hypothetical protein